MPALIKVSCADGPAVHQAALASLMPKSVADTKSDNTQTKECPTLPTPIGFFQQQVQLNIGAYDEVDDSSDEL